MIAECEHAADGQSAPTMPFPFGVLSCENGTRINCKFEFTLEPERGSESSQVKLMQEKDIEDFLESVYLLDKLKETRRAIDRIFDLFNDLLQNGQSSTCNRIIANVDVGRISSTLIVAFLSITLRASGIWARMVFFKRSYEKLTSERGEERTKKLLLKYL